MQETDPIDYPDRIRRIRRQNELTQTRMAELMGVSFATINRWENSQSKPSALAWQQLLRAERYGIDALSPDFHPPSVVRETATEEYGARPSYPSTPDFTADPKTITTVTEAHRLTYGHLSNPVFATEVSRIDPLPHQRIAVYEHMLHQSRLRYLLADDAGAGKTIMSGLYVREMLARRLIHRILVVAPAGLVGNWHRELQHLFSLNFRIVSGAEARTGNPFKDDDSNQLIISIDTLSSERMFSRFQEDDVVPYDLVIFDEAHKLSARRDPDGTFRATDRYRLAEAIAGIPSEDARWKLNWSARHVLLLTATPHMGKDFPYYCLWRLLEPDVLSTIDAFNAYPKDARSHHFIRRTKEEMVRFDGSRIYPKRISDTLSYDLSKGEVGEQALYDATTVYIETYYNKAKLLNRTAVHFAISIFQRRLASSTWALIRSFERRIGKLDGLIDDITSGRITAEQLEQRQRSLDETDDKYYSTTADEEAIEDGREEDETSEEKLFNAVVATNLSDLAIEKNKVQELLALANKVHALGIESKFETLREFLADPKYRDEKIIIFTEHRDTLDFLVRRMEGRGYTGRIAQIHGGLDYKERDAQVEFFRRPNDEGGARYLIATDAAGEGINLQFCWITVNYDLPWNFARLEQRMGRIHRYGQKHDPVVIMNLVAGKTREGRVMRTLLTKMETTRKQLGSDKVYDSVGRVFDGVSIRDYMEMALTDEGAAKAEKAIQGKLTKEQVEAITERERCIYGEGGDVSKELPRLLDAREKEVYCRLLPGYVRQFLQKACPLLGLEIEGNLDDIFSLKATQRGALDSLWAAMEQYPQEQQNRFILKKPEPGTKAIYMHPGEMLFDFLCEHVCHRFGAQALRGGSFVDASSQEAYFFHLALVKVVRKADPQIKALAQSEVQECRLVGLHQAQDGTIIECPLEHLLLLQPAQHLPSSAIRFAGTVKSAMLQANQHAQEKIVANMAAEQKEAMLTSLPEREDFVRRGYDYQEAELAARRIELAKKFSTGNTGAGAELTRIRDQQKRLSLLRDEAVAVLRREPELIEPSGVEFLVHALVVPSNIPEDKLRQDDEVDQIAMRTVIAFEESEGAQVHDVRNPVLARAAGLIDWPGFDVLSLHAEQGEKDIEVKGRADVGHVEVSENEWAKACNLRDRYWLYVVYNCASPKPRIIRIRDPFGKLIVKARGGVSVDAREILAAGEDS